MSDFGNRLKASRKASKMTQVELAQVLGVAQSTIAGYEHNKRFPSGPILRALADVLKVQVDYLMGLSVPNHTSEGQARPFTGDFDHLYTEFIKLALNGQESQATDLIIAAFKKGAMATELIEQVFIKALKEVGDLWASGVINESVEHMVAHLIDHLVVLTAPKSQDKNCEKTVLLMVPSSEEHVLILKMMRTYFIEAGYRAIFLGKSVPLQSLKWLIIHKQVDLLAVSITMSTHINTAAYLLDGLKSIQSIQPFQVLVGGSGIEDPEALKNHLAYDFYFKNLQALKVFLKQT